MRRLISLFGILCLCLLLMPPALAADREEPVYGITGEGSVNLRELPSIDAQIVAIVPEGTRVRVLGRQTEWYYIQMPEGLAGYMNIGFVSLVRQGTVENGAAHVNLRAAPSYEAAILGQYESGTEVEVYREEGEWALVGINGTTGYMSALFLRLAQQPQVFMPEITPVPVAATEAPTPSIAPTPAPVVDVTAAVISPEAPTAPPQGSAPPNTPEPFFTPKPAGMESAQTLPPVENAAPAGSPFYLPMDGERPLVQQYGVSESYVDYRDAFDCTIVYPVSGLDAADQAMRAWAQGLVREAEAQVLAADRVVEVEVAAQYDAYLVGGRYVGVLETGWHDSTLLPEPADIVFTMNIDLKTGSLLSYEHIFSPAAMPGVLERLRTSLSAIEGLDASALILGEEWLSLPVLTPEGVAVLLPKGMYLPDSLGTQYIVFPYAELASSGQLALEAPQAAPPAVEVVDEGARPVAPGERVIDPTRPMVALTFDDGPSETTPKILELLSQYGGRATFFVVGNRLDNYSEELQQIAQQGSEIGCHTWSHKKLTTLGASSVERQITKTNESVLAYTGQQVALMRPPYGSQDPQVRSVCKRLGLSVITWSIDTEDWRTRDAGATYDVIMENVVNGSIILCHDLHEATGVAMERVIPELSRQGYQLVTVSELLSFLEGGMEPGVSYFQLKMDQVVLPQGSGE